MANENKTKKTETTPQGAPDSVQFPVLKDGRWVCSDGFRTQDAYIARQHEKLIKQ